ncbi:MAG: MBL fold metallo-hydrolase, partial [Pseudonocardia sp.]|nr:MBL fold metallo-hydrolase [Pseudonocardia sp.]
AATQRRAESLRAAVAGVTGRDPDVLVNTHHHGDHVFGNAVFTPAATVVAHERTRIEMAAAGFGLRHLFPDVGWGDLPLVLPLLTYADGITVHAGDLPVHLVHPGAAHTTNDTVAWIPDRGVLFTGDIVMSRVTPYCLMGSVTGSLAAITRLRALGATTVVPGHGPVGGPELLDSTARYLTWVLDLARDGLAAGVDVLDLARGTDLGEFAGLLDSERIVGNLHRAYADLADPADPGRPIDVGASFMAMVSYHGGPLTCHA